MQTEVVVEVKLTGRPVDEVAPARNGVVPSARFPIEKKVMVWIPGPTTKLCGTSGAGSQLELPAWLAVIVHVPCASMLTAVPATVQTPDVAEVNVTASTELEVAAT